MKKLVLSLLLFLSSRLFADITVLREAIAKQDIEQIKLELSTNKEITKDERTVLLRAAFRATEEVKLNIPFKDHLKATLGFVSINVGGMLALFSALMFGLAAQAKDKNLFLKGLIPTTGAVITIGGGYKLMCYAPIGKARDIEELILNIKPVS